ncbi:MAG: hypothetical protein ACK5HB_08105 [Ignavibacteria bacterium]|jgi:hypothetical protein
MYKRILFFVFLFIIITYYPSLSQERYFYVPTGSVAEKEDLRFQGYVHFFQGGKFSLLESMYGISGNNEIGIFAWHLNGSLFYYGLNYQHTFELKKNINASILGIASIGGSHGTALHIIPSMQFKKLTKESNATIGLLYGRKNNNVSYIHLVMGVDYDVKIDKVLLKGELITGTNWNSGLYIGGMYNINNNITSSLGICIKNFNGLNNQATFQVKYNP